MANILNSFNEVAKNEGITITKLEQKLGASKGVLSRALSNNSDIQSKWLTKLVENYPQYNPEWLITGNGSMLKTNTENPEPPKNMVPFYDDVHSVGGTQQLANTDASYITNVKIDAGDWFSGATAAIRHYGDSMVEYKYGCTLVIREIRDRNEIVWGRNYVVETDEMRITKKIVEFDDKHIMCYSTNNETFPDGTLIHQPIKVKKTNIRHLSRVLGSVNKEESTGMVQL
ncbi:MAG: hypothetical protein C4K58_06780 [Flavobacteriaceae bacterium]|nr:MAG: hypothetical protein C4K58_06780 [Flavobacteriaceae bacterium]